MHFPKERKKMDIQKILTEYDAMFGVKSLEEIEEFLVQKIQEAGEQAEIGIVVTLLNEIIGFYRDTTQKEKALTRCQELTGILQALQMEGRLEYATSLLNIANAYRAFGLLGESLAAYGEVEKVYLEKLPAGDFGFANLYNNWSLLYQEMEEFENARDMLRRALRIVDSYETALIPQATTRTNLAATLLQMGSQKAYGEAVSYLQEALKIFERDGGRDFHYGAALTALGDAYTVQKKYDKAAENYEAGLREIEKHVGRTDNYARVLEKYRYVKGLAEKKNTPISNLERCRAFYEQYGRPMIHEKFPAYENRIAVGMVGEGSDCYGYDDEISADHDYGLGFCLWLTEEDFGKIGPALQEAYDQMVENAAGDIGGLSEELARELAGELSGKLAGEGMPGSNRFLASRRGVFSIARFYGQMLGVRWDFEGNFTPDFEAVEEWRLSAAVNGQVFRDDLGLFLAVREKLQAYYPAQVWRRKLAQALHEFSQYAQSNYARMMARGDGLTADLCAAKGMEAAMDLVYLLSRRFAPYYKWKKKGLENSALGAKVLPALEEIVKLPEQSEAWKNVTYRSTQINLLDGKVRLFEQVAEFLLEEMRSQGLVRGRDPFLEQYVGQLLEPQPAPGAAGAAGVMAKTEVVKGKLAEGEEMDYVEKIVELEWKQFDQVKNEGGRADCQDDFGTFSIMRRSQYMAWPEPLLESFCGDLLAAQARGWNLITEKYARMMKSTAPERYAQLEKDLPRLSDQRILIQEEIIRIQVQWMEAFAKEYPRMAGNARSIRTAEDSTYNTSYETYLRGELGTYSENTFVLYGRFIAGLLQEGRNLAYEIMDNTARLYGYTSVEEAEARLS